MPTYTFECKKCGLIELDLKMKDSTLSICPKCGTKDLKRVYANIGINVKNGTPTFYPKGK